LPVVVVVVVVVVLVMMVLVVMVGDVEVDGSGHDGGSGRRRTVVDRLEFIFNENL
jgi:preprotein translocase subunit SecG